MHLLLVSLLSLATLFVNPPTPTDWTAYTSPEGKFSAALPANPQTSVVVTETAKGPLYTHTVSANDEDRNEYLVSWTSYDRTVESRATEKTFDRVRDALILSKGGKLAGESSISMLGRRARAITFTDSDGRVVKARFYFIGKCFYQVMAESRSKENFPDSERFFESFKVEAS